MTEKKTILKQIGRAIHELDKFYNSEERVGGKENEMRITQARKNLINVLFSNGYELEKDTYKVTKSVLKRDLLPTNFKFEVVFQIKSPEGEWKDHETYPDDGNFELSDIYQDYIDNMVREFRQDLPTYKTRTLNRITVNGLIHENVRL